MGEICGTVSIFKEIVVGGDSCYLYTGTWREKYGVLLVKLHCSQMDTKCHAAFGNVPTFDLILESNPLKETDTFIDLFGYPTFNSNMMLTVRGILEKRL